MFYQCSDCGNIAAEFLTLYEPHGEKVKVCPACRSDSVSKQINDYQFLGLILKPRI